jgi:hypothetical protein
MHRAITEGKGDVVKQKMNGYTMTKEQKQNLTKLLEKS